MKPNKASAKRLSSGLVTLAIVSPALLAFSGCGGSNCDSNFSTPQTSDDCGRGGRTGSGGFIRGGTSGGFNGDGTSASGSQRGGFGGFGRSFGAGS